MSRDSAEQIILRICSNEIQLEYARHARQMLAKRAYGVPDVRAILKSHIMKGPPQWIEERGNFRVELWGKCLEGTHTGVVLGLRENGQPCVVITIMPIEKKLRAQYPRARRRKNK